MSETASCRTYQRNRTRAVPLLEEAHPSAELGADVDRGEEPGRDAVGEPLAGAPHGPHLHHGRGGRLPPVGVGEQRADHLRQAFEARTSPNLDDRGQDGDTEERETPTATSSDLRPPDPAASPTTAGAGSTDGMFFDDPVRAAAPSRSHATRAVEREPEHRSAHACKRLAHALGGVDRRPADPSDEQHAVRVSDQRDGVAAQRASPACPRSGCRTPPSRTRRASRGPHPPSTAAGRSLEDPAGIRETPGAFVA